MCTVCGLPRILLVCTTLVHLVLLINPYNYILVCTTLVCVVFVATTTSTISVYYVLFVATTTYTISVYYFSMCTVCGHYHV